MYPVHRSQKNEVNKKAIFQPVSCILIFWVVASGYCFSVQAQSCQILIRGTVQDTVLRQSLEKASVWVDGKVVAITDTAGIFQVGSICAGKHQVTITHQSYSTITYSLFITKDTSISFLPGEKSGELERVTVTGITEKKPPLSTIASTSIKAEQLFQTRGATLGESLKNISGLNSLQTGPSLSKPIIHGLHSNRVLILNNGIRQEGQQWGSEHAPEIDPFIASRITIIKGAASVMYGSEAIAGVVLVEPPALEPQKKLEGEVNMVAASNGRMGVFSGLLQGALDKKLTGLSWRLQGTLKRAGNFTTPHYYLKNTGLYERDFSGTLAYRKNNYELEVYYSEFHNRVGIFEGSHVGNVNDLYAAFKRTVPITASYFSYDINRTYQNINHDLFKASGSYKFRNGSKAEIVFARQQNLREEYDIDLPYSADPAILAMPQISFKIKTHTLDLVYHWRPGNHFSGSVGMSGSTQGNVFKGIRYLVPNFRNYTGGAFAIERYTKNKLVLEAGVRYDYRWLRVYQLNNNTLQTYHTTSNYNNVTGTAGATYKISNHFSINSNIGSGWRAPSVNELYINGIHLSAASYERGDSSLKSERSYNFTVALKYENDRFSAEAVAYDNIINNFIYAKPSLQPITLISGTYPYFKYTQVNVNMKGFDLDLNYKPFNRVSLLSKTSIVRAWNKTIDDYLIFMPADRFDNSIKYILAGWKNARNIYVSIQNISVLKQTRVPPNSDYVDPPSGYSIFNIHAGLTTTVCKKDLMLNVGVENATNRAYRDYLNRFRYYADDLGVNFIIRASYKF